MAETCSKYGIDLDSVGAKVNSECYTFPGICSCCIDFNGEALTDIDEISKKLNINVVTARIGNCRNPALNGPERIVIVSSHGYFAALYNYECMGHRALGMISLGVVDEIFERDEEVGLYNLNKNIQELEEKRKVAEYFLKDPWKGYRAKKKRYAEKLQKTKLATNLKIEETKKQLEKIRKETKKLEKDARDMLTGQKKNREGD